MTAPLRADEAQDAEDAVRIGPDSVCKLVWFSSNFCFTQL